MTDRRASLLRACPNVFSYKTVLYVGACQSRHDFLMNSPSEPGNGFIENGCTIDVLEILPENVQYLKTLDGIRNVILGDARTFETKDKYDLVFWWHGPEHILQSEIPNALYNIEQYTKIAVVLGCPWGYNNQGNICDNLNEQHISHNDVDLFQNLGYQTITCGNKNEHGSNITSIKYLKCL